MTSNKAAEDQEKSDFLDTLSTHRSFLRHAVRDLTDEQAGQRTTVSELCLGGLIKHVTRAERRWTGFIVGGPAAMDLSDEAAMKAHTDSFRMQDGDTLAGLLESYEEVARNTSDLVTALPSLDASQPLPCLLYTSCSSRSSPAWKRSRASSPTGRLLTARRPPASTSRD